MKKLIFGLVGILLSGNVFASDLKVGDKMPTIAIGSYPNIIKNLVDKKNIFKGKVLGIDTEGNNIIDTVQVYLSCGKVIKWNENPKPFLIYSAKGEIYIDNKPLDGSINRISTTEKEEGKDFMFYAPVCPKR